MAETDNVNSNPPVDIAIESEYFSDNDYSFNQMNFQNDDGNAHGPMIDPNYNYFFNRNLLSCNYYYKPTFKTGKDCLKIVHFNARSLNANFTQIESYISSFEVMFDVIIISETWNDPTTLKPYNIPMYNVFHVCRENAKGGAVDIMYIKTLTVAKY